MISMDSEVKRALDLRLAKGEITVDYYRKLIREILAAQKNKESTTPQPRSTLLASIDDIFVYTTHIQVAGRRKEFSAVEKIDGGLNCISINLIPSVKHSWISVIFDNGDSYYMDEDRRVFGRNRHDQILKCVAELKKATFSYRVSRLENTLIRLKHVEIGKESNETYTLVGAIKDSLLRKKSAAVILCGDGFITNGRLSLDLKKCRREGLLDLGVRRANKTAPGQVYACYEKSFLEKSRAKALIFDVSGDFDQDAVMAVLDRLAEPGNSPSIKQ